MSNMEKRYRNKIIIIIIILQITLHINYTPHNSAQHIAALA